MIQPISFTSDYSVQLKTKYSKKKPSKKQTEKQINFLKFQQCCEALINGIDGVMFSSENFSDNKECKNITTLHVPNASDDVVESYLLYNNIKFKKKHVEN